MNGKNKDEAVITNFIYADKFKYDEKKRNKIRKQLKIASSDIVLGNVGGFTEIKNQKFIIEMISKMPSQYKAVIVGGGPLRNSLENAIEQYDVRSRVTLIDNVSDIENYYNAFDYFLLPSLGEGLPFVSVEAQCNGLLNILSDNVPKSTKITDKVVFLKLDSNFWAQYIMNCRLSDKKERASGYQAIEKAGFTDKTAPNEIIKKLKEIAYE